MRAGARPAQRCPVARAGGTWPRAPSARRRATSRRRLGSPPRPTGGSRGRRTSRSPGGSRGSSRPTTHRRPHLARSSRRPKAGRGHPLRLRCRSIRASRRRSARAHRGGGHAATHSESWRARPTRAMPPNCRGWARGRAPPTRRVKPAGSAGNSTRRSTRRSARRSPASGLTDPRAKASFPPRSCIRRGPRPRERRSAGCARHVPVRVRATDETSGTGRCCGPGAPITGRGRRARRSARAREPPPRWMTAASAFDITPPPAAPHGERARRTQWQRSAGVHARGSAAFALPRDSARDDVRSPGPWLPGPP
jgi:hypothetical protein